MQIILVDKRMACARTFTVSARLVIFFLLGLTTVIVFLSCSLSFLAVRTAAVIRIPVISDLMSLVTRDDVARSETLLHDNVSAMARQLGEVQAQLMRLDAVGERVSKLAGIAPEEFDFSQKPGRGGPLIEPRAASLQEIDTELQRLSRSVDQRRDYMSVLESEFMTAQVRKNLLPNSQPVSGGFIGSGFGMRVDPFTGQMTRHEGIDFVAPTGTPIHAAAGGVVVTAGPHPEFGNLIEVDHGNDLVTRYAHASRADVRVGDIVKRGQQLGEIGMTGRATGPHLHFEVLVKGTAQNPAKYLVAKDGPLAPQLAAGSPSLALAVDAAARK